MSGGVKAVLFDLDGTLIETAPEIADAVNDALAAVDLAAIGLPMVRDWIGHGTATLLVSALGHRLNLDADGVKAWARYAEAVTAFDAAYEARCGTRSHLYDGVRDTLEQLRARGVRTAVVTNKEGRFTDRVLAAHRLQSSFDVVISGDTLATKKPNPAGIEHALATMGATAAGALFVGDSSIDVQTARNAGLSVWVLPYGYNMGQPIADSQPDRLLQGFEQVLDAVPVASSH
jgi:phosphoglycolate phosphatase